MAGGGPVATFIREVTILWYFTKGATLLVLCCDVETAFFFSLTVEV